MSLVVALTLLIPDLAVVRLGQGAGQGAGQGQGQVWRHAVNWTRARKRLLHCATLYKVTARPTLTTIHTRQECYMNNSLGSGWADTLDIIKRYPVWYKTVICVDACALLRCLCVLSGQVICPAIVCHLVPAIIITATLTHTTDTTDPPPLPRFKGSVGIANVRAIAIK